MSSQSDFQQSSSSSMESPLHKKEAQIDPRQRSRSRSRDRKKPPLREQNKYKSISEYQRRIKQKNAHKKARINTSTDELQEFHIFASKKKYNSRVKKLMKTSQKESIKYTKEIGNKAKMKVLSGIIEQDDTWFIEKYNPDMIAQNQRKKKQYAISNAIQFFEKIENIYCDANLAIQQPVPKQLQQTTMGFISNMDREQDQQNNNTIPINSQSVDIILNVDIDITKSPYFGFDPDCLTLFIKAVPKNISKMDIHQVFSKLPGFKNIFLSGPVKKLSFARYCWISFTDQKSFKDAEAKVSGLMIKQQPLSSSSSSSKNRRIKVLKKYPKSRIQKDVQASLKLIKKLDEEKGIQKNPLYSMEFNSEQKKFDIFLLYLRKVHGYDYFSGCEFENERALSLKLGLSFLRVQSDYQQLPDITTVFKKAEENALKRAKQEIEFDPITNLRQQIENMIMTQLKLTEDQKQEKTKWDCNYCDKKFRTIEFLSKHIIGKHPDIREKNVKSMMEKSYLKDPNKITNYSIYREDRDFRRGRGYRRDRRREYHDLDEPQGEKIEKVVSKPVVNFLDI